MVVLTPRIKNIRRKESNKKMRNGSDPCTLEDINCIYESLQEEIDSLRSLFEEMVENFDNMLDEISDELDSLKAEFSVAGLFLKRYSRRAKSKMALTLVSPENTCGAFRPEDDPDNLPF